ncbi:MAG: ATP-binding protein [Acidobacteriota bacterium]|nr:ATP-binding protein [Acidobacteriota bacterium]
MTMLKPIRRMSLRTRLALLAAFAIVALAIASFVAWRLARATETFAVRQADSSVHAAARDLARELQTNPNGFENIGQALAVGPDGRDEKGPGGADRRARPVPRHIENLFATYSDPLVRLTAITLHRFPDVEGGFYRSSDRAIIGYATAKDSPASADGNGSLELVELIRSLASKATATGLPATLSTQFGGDRTILVAYPAQPDGIASAWAMQRLSHLSGVSDWPNLAALVALALSIIAVSGLALITVRDLRSGVTGIEAGLACLTNDLNQQLAQPDTEELARIAAAINELAATLRTNIARQASLEQELRKSERLSALGRVVAGVAHEVRNPLAAIKLKAQLAGRSAYAPEKLAETFKVITDEIDRLDSLVRRLLELGAHRPLKPGPIDLVELVTRRANFFTDLAAHSGVVITAKAIGPGILVQGDGDRLGQVIDNIIQNAIEAMPDGGQLSITCAGFEGQNGTPTAHVTFDDTGQGISEADQGHMFEPFHTGRDNGTGLGLAIARAIVEEHGGHLSFVSRVGSGASFVLELPLPPSA